MLKKIFYQNKLFFITLIIFIILNSLAILYLPEQMNNIITYGLNGDLASLTHSGIIMFITIILITTFTIIISYISSTCSANIATYLRESLYTKILSFTPEKFSKYPISTLITRSTSDITNIQNTFNLSFKNLITALIISLLGIFKLSKITEPILLLIIFISIILIVSFLLCLFILTTPKFIHLQNLTDQLNHHLRDELTGLMTIKAYNNEKYFSQEFTHINKKYSHTDYTINKIMNYLNPSTALILNFTIILIMASTLKGLSSPISIASLLSITEYTIQIISAFLTLALLFILVPKAKVSYKRIMEILSTPSATTTDTYLPTPKSITFQNVSFSYNDHNILENLNFTIEKGDKIAIVGPIGSGKSTILKLLTRALEPTTGTILYTQTSAINYSFSLANKIFSYLPQKPYIFKGTITSNIQIFNPKITPQALQKLLRDFSLTELSPNHKINAGGTNISGGQKQRLALACAFSSPQDYIIIDDIFTGLDNQTISHISHKLLTTYKNKTIIVTSSTTTGLTNFNKIIVLNQGHITNINTHHYLLKYDNVYQSLAKEVSYEDN